MYFGVLFKLFKVLEFMVLKREMMSKSVKRGWQKTWAPGGWRLGYSGDLGAQAVAPKWLLLGGLASDDGIDIVFEIQGVLTW